MTREELGKFEKRNARRCAKTEWGGIVAREDLVDPEEEIALRLDFMSDLGVMLFTQRVIYRCKLPFSLIRKP